MSDLALRMGTRRAVKRDSPASFAAFKKAGFVVRAEAEIKGVQSYELGYVRPFGDQSRMG